MEDFLLHIEKRHTTSYLLSIWSLIETRTDLDPSVWSLMGRSCGLTMEPLAAFNEVFDFSPAAFNWAQGALDRSSWGSSKWMGAGVLVPGAQIKIWQTRSCYTTRISPFSLGLIISSKDFFGGHVQICKMRSETAVIGKPATFFFTSMLKHHHGVHCFWLRENNSTDTVIGGHDYRHKSWMDQKSILYILGEQWMSGLKGGSLHLCIIHWLSAVCRCCSVPCWHGTQGSLHSPQAHCNSCSCLALPDSAWLCVSLVVSLRWLAGFSSRRACSPGRNSWKAAQARPLV